LNNQYSLKKMKSRKVKEGIPRVGTSERGESIRKG
jgi:hypothetical protein